MWWKILYHLFGWHFFHGRNSYHNVIRRVRTTSDGKRYGVWYRNTFIWLDEKSHWKITPLTYSDNQEEL